MIKVIELSRINFITMHKCTNVLPQRAMRNKVDGVGIWMLCKPA